MLKTNVIAPATGLPLASKSRPCSVRSGGTTPAAVLDETIAPAMIVEANPIHSLPRILERPPRSLRRADDAALKPVRSRLADRVAPRRFAHGADELVVRALAHVAAGRDVRARLGRRGRHVRAVAARVGALLGVAGNRPVAHRAVAAGGRVGRGAVAPGRRVGGALGPVGRGRVRAGGRVGVAAADAEVAEE